MRSERRHELQHNELADWLFKTGEQVKPYQNLILAAVVAVIVVVAAYSWWSRSAAAKSAEAWTELSASMQSANPDDALTKVVESYPNTNVGHVAAVVLADFRLTQGCDQRFVNKALASQALNGAVTSYSLVLEQSRTPSLVERATFGMARAKEAQCDLDAAKKRYKEVVENWPKGAYATTASQRLEDLGQRETKLMFDDLRDPNFNPNPAFSEESEARGTMPNLDMPEETPIETPKTTPAAKVDDKKPGKAEEKKK